MTTKTMTERLLMAVLSNDNPAQAAFDFIKKRPHLVGWQLAEDQILKDTHVALVYLQKCKRCEWPELKAKLDASKNMIGQILYHEALREDGINVAKAEKDWLIRHGLKRTSVVRPKFGGKQ